MKTLGGKFGLFSSRQKLRCRVILRVTTTSCVCEQMKKSLIMIYRRTETYFMLISPFYAYQSTRVLLYLSGLFMLIRQRVTPFMLISVEKKMQLTYLETTVFWHGLSIFSQPNQICFLLDLSVIYRSSAKKPNAPVRSVWILVNQKHALMSTKVIKIGVVG